MVDTKGETHKLKKANVKMALDVVQTMSVLYAMIGPVLLNTERLVTTGYLQFIFRNPLSPNPDMVVSQKTRRMASMITTGKGNSRLDTIRKTFAPT